MNLVVNDLRFEIKQANTYSEDAFGSFGKFDFVMANPPFNVKDVKVATVEQDKRFNTYGIPRNKTKKKGEETCPNANYLWINLFATSLKENGRAALVMANSASDARNSEADIRQKLIDENLIYGMLTLPSNMFYTVTLPATLWFFDKSKRDNNKILFIDARNIFTQIDRAHREFSDEQIQNIAIINHLYKNDTVAYISLIDEYFSKGISELTENKSLIEPLSDKIEAFLKKQNETNIPNLNEKLSEINKFEEKVKNYKTAFNLDNISQMNETQKNLTEEFKPFFADIHTKLKEIDKLVRKQTKDKDKKKAREFEKETKQIKIDLENLHKVVKDAEVFFIHINWLQERFPNAEYEDVTGLCKAATPEEVEEQDYSLNPGRYVGVVIEEDGKTEEEFIEEIASLNVELSKLNSEAKDLENIINQNIKEIIGE